MAGLTKRYCRVTCACEGECDGSCTGSNGEPCTPFREDTAVKGLCGCCQSAYYPCDANEENCGDWQCDESEGRDCCDCGTNACGDGHNCPRYIDIEFTLDAFVIQGKTCCNAPGIPLTQQCGGALADQHAQEITPWTALGGGLTDYVIYEKTVHRLRLTRQDCGCYWGGFWSSSCNTNTCCCDSSCDDGDPSTGDNVYPNCLSDCGTSDCYNLIGCNSVTGGTNAAPCQPCDPSNPCYPTDDGFASSQDRFGTGNIGTSIGSLGGICAEQTGLGGADDCNYWQDDCDSHIGSGGTAFACWDCGAFQPHHIQAYLTYTQVALEGHDMGQCNVAWVLDIRGLTEQMALEFGNHGSFTAYDGPGAGGTTNVCSFTNGARFSDSCGYHIRLQGRGGICNTDCVDEWDGAIPEMIQHSCGCPPHLDFETTANVTNAFVAFHPTALFAPAALGSSVPQVYNCVINDEDGLGTHCQDNVWGSAACIGIQKNLDGSWTDGTCYGVPDIFFDSCQHSYACCEGNWSASCSDPSDCALGSGCSCAGPDAFNPTLKNKQYPCEHCQVTHPQLNHDSCRTCVGGYSAPCTPCRIVMTPNDSSQPAWESSGS